jgi:hypothetical protein
MSESVVVYSVAPDAEPEADIAQRLHAKGMAIIEQQPHMLLVEGEEFIVREALGNAHGWKACALTTVPLPNTRERVVRRP